MADRSQLSSRPVRDAIADFYRENPRQLQLLILKAHRAAIQGSKGHFDSIVELLDGPARIQTANVSPISHISTDAERERAQAAVKQLKELEGMEERSKRTRKRGATA
jgi:hypothetical protein